MWPITRRELMDLNKTVANLEARMRLVEEESKTTKAVRQARADRRDWYVSKLIPSVSGLVVAILGANAIWHFL
jgi:hypothetical protein